MEKTKNLINSKKHRQVPKGARAVEGQLTSYSRIPINAVIAAKQPLNRKTNVEKFRHK